jgi:Uma2 family endonuclease
VSKDPIYEVLPAHLELLTVRGFSYEAVVTRPGRHEKYWMGADLVMEVVSDDPKDRERDLETKPREYARAGIPEYWIIDPQERRVHVLTLAGKAYQVHGEFGPGSQASSVLLPGFTAEVDAVLTPPGSRQAK